MNMNEPYTFCPYCAAKMTEKRLDHRSRRVCPECGFVQYRNPAPAVGVLVEEEGKVLLVRRKFEPYKGLWVIPSGFVEYEEDVRETAVRELEEETGLKVEITALHAAESCFDDPRGNTILILYRGNVVGGELKAGDDAIEAGFFELGSLPEIAFEAHRKVLGELGGE